MMSSTASIPFRGFTFPGATTGINIGVSVGVGVRVRVRFRRYMIWVRKLGAMDYGLEVMGQVLEVTDYGLWVTEYR